MEKIFKIFVTVPQTHTDEVIKAMANAGAGIIGTYTHCAYITKGFGNFMPEEGSDPFIGEVGQMSREPEDKIEMPCPKDKLDSVIKAIQKVHPYETPLIDVYEVTLYTR